MSNASNGFLLVSTICDLANKSADNVDEGCLAFVVETGQYFRLATDASPATPNAITVMTTLGGPAESPCVQSYTGAGIGRWLLTNLGDIQNPFADVADWYIDPVAGLDTNTGLTSISPLKTFHALAARWVGITQPAHATVTVHVIDGTALATGDQIIVERPFNADFPLIIRGFLTSQTTGVITTLTAPNTGANTGERLDGTLAALTWASYIGKIVRITTVGPHLGACAVVAAHVGGTTARITPFMLETSGVFSNVTPANGSTYEIVDAIAVNDGVTGDMPYVDISNAGKIIFTGFNLNDNGLAAPTSARGVASAAWAIFYGCQSDLSNTFTTCADANVRFSVSQVNTPGLQALGVGLEHESCVLDAVGTIPNGIMTVASHSCMRDAGVLTPAAKQVNVTNFDITNAGTPALDLPAHATALFAGALYGTGASSVHISLHDFVHAEYTPAATFPAVVAALQHPLDFQNAVLKDYADRPFGSTATFSDSQAFFLEQK